MAEHTPGPWEVAQSPAWGTIVQTEKDTAMLIRMERVAFTSDGIKLLSFEANAALIAAAPDLLAAMPTLPHPGGKLIKVVAYYEDGTTQTIDGEVITAAVEKARGEDGG